MEKRSKEDLREEKPLTPIAGAGWAGATGACKPTTMLFVLAGRKAENEKWCGSWPAGSCVMAAIDKYTRTTEILGEKKGLCCHSLSQREGPEPRPGPAVIVFLGTLHQGWSSFTMHGFILGG